MLRWSRGETINTDGGIVCIPELLAFPLFLSQVLGSYIRNNYDTANLIKEIQSIASKPTEKYFFNVSEEAALSTIAGTLGSRIFNIEGEYFFPFTVSVNVHSLRHVTVCVLWLKGFWEYFTQVCKPPSLQMLDSVYVQFVQFQFEVHFFIKEATTHIRSGSC